MSNTIIIKHGYSLPDSQETDNYSGYVRFDGDSTQWSEAKASHKLYEQDNQTHAYVLTTDTEPVQGKIYFTPSIGIVALYELIYPTEQGGGRVYINDNGTPYQIGRKIFVQSVEPNSSECMEGDLWVNTADL